MSTLAGSETGEILQCQCKAVLQAVLVIAPSRTDIAIMSTFQPAWGLSESGVAPTAYGTRDPATGHSHSPAYIHGETRSTTNNDRAVSPGLPPQNNGNGMTRDLAYRDKPKLQTNPTSKKEQRICAQCGEPLTGQFVRALNGTFHLECFRCRVCIMFISIVIVLTHLRTAVKW